VSHHPTTHPTHPRTRPARRPASRPATGLVPAAAVLAVVGLAVAAGPATAATAPTSTVSTATVTTRPGDRGLYGVQDPTYDGVLRQGYALVALRTAGRAVPASAVGWLLRQQCADGSFASYRAATRAACSPRTPNGRDTNATAAAVIGLRAVGTPAARAAAGRAVGWLERVQNRDGGVGFTFRAATDANSTGLFVEALVASRVDPATVRSAAGHTPVQALVGLQVSCSGPRADRGALDYQRERPLRPNSLATTGALLGLAGGTLPVAPRASTAAVPRLGCGVARRPRTRVVAAAAAAGWTARELGAHHGVVPGLDGRTPDVGQTVGALLGLVRDGVADRQVARTVARLQGGLLRSWVRLDGRDRPAAAAEAILLAHALGARPTDFGGVDYVRRLVATGPRA